MRGRAKSIRHKGISFLEKVAEIGKFFACSCINFRRLNFLLKRIVSVLWKQKKPEINMTIKTG